MEVQIFTEIWAIFVELETTLWRSQCYFRHYQPLRHPGHKIWIHASFAGIIFLVYQVSICGLILLIEWSLVNWMVLPLQWGPVSRFAQFGSHTDLFEHLYVFCLNIRLKINVEGSHTTSKHMNTFNRSNVCCKHWADLDRISKVQIWCFNGFLTHSHVISWVAQIAFTEASGTVLEFRRQMEVKERHEEAKCFIGWSRFRTFHNCI